MHGNRMLYFCCVTIADKLRLQYLIDTSKLKLCDYAIMCINSVHRHCTWLCVVIFCGSLGEFPHKSNQTESLYTSAWKKQRTTPQTHSNQCGGEVRGLPVAHSNRHGDSYRLMVECALGPQSLELRELPGTFQNILGCHILTTWSQVERSEAS